MNLILLGSVGVYMNVSLSMQYNLKDLNFFSSYYFLFHQGLGFNEALLQKLQNYARMEQVFSDLFLKRVSLYSHK